ncbi:hypothetical protein D3C75_140990 [compost metagenome]
MASLLKVNGETVVPPTDFGYEYYNLTKSGRVASGKMTMEIVAQKRKFSFSYASMSGATMAQIKRLIFNPAIPFFSLEYADESGPQVAIVYSGAIKATRFRTEMGWYYKSVTFDLIEQ